MASATLYLASSVSGGAASPDNALGPEDRSWTGNTGTQSWTHRWQCDPFPSDLAAFDGNLTLNIRARRDGGFLTPQITTVRAFQGGAEIAAWTNNTSHTSASWRTHTLAQSALTGTGPLDIEIVTAADVWSSWGSAIQINMASLEFGYIAGLPTPLKHWNGTSWDEGVLRRWNGSAWVHATVKMWNGSEWADME